MPIPTKWKLVAGTVTAVVGVSAAAAAMPGSQSDEIELADVVSINGLTSAPAHEFAQFASLASLFAADDSHSSPFDSVDTDGDGITDVAEATLGTDRRNPDTDGDGLSDGDEVAEYGTNPLIADTDGDGHSDGNEVAAGSDPLDPAVVPGPDEPEESPESAHSADSPHSAESADSADSPHSGDSADSPHSSDSPDTPDSVDSPEVAFEDRPDTDGDGLSDVAEATLGTDPEDKDSDNDGLSDGEEVLRHGTDPNDFDTDDDGFGDGDEVNASTDPLNPADFPGLDESPESTD